MAVMRAIALASVSTLGATTCADSASDGAPDFVIEVASADVVEAAVFEPRHSAPVDAGAVADADSADMDEEIDDCGVVVLVLTVAENAALSDAACGVQDDDNIEVVVVDAFAPTLPFCARSW